ncbi:MAG: hypothetical protein GQ468_05350 [Candidatus Scalindua sp.]|nr:hypothetical protein [Candidatus Scalindua sp.]
MSNEKQTYKIEFQADGKSLKTETKAATKTIEQLEKELVKVRKELDKTDKSTKKAGKGMNRFGKSLQDSASSMAVIQGPLGGVAGRMNTLGAAVSRGALKWVGLSVAIGASLFIQKRAIAVAAQTEQQLKRIESQLILTGNGVGFLTEQLDQFARQTARDSLSSSEDIREAISVMLTFRSVSGQAFKDAIRASNSISAITGASVKSIAIQLGKALEDARTGLTALRRQGISFTTDQRKEIIRLVDEGRKSDAAEKLLGIINTQIPDASEAMGTLTSKVDSLNQSWTELLETVAASDFAKGSIGLLDTFLIGAKEILDPSKVKEAARLTGALKRIKAELVELHAIPEKSFFDNLKIRNAETRFKVLNDQALKLLASRKLIAAEEEKVANDASAKLKADEQVEIDLIAHKTRLTLRTIEARRNVEVVRNSNRFAADEVKKQFKANEISAIEYFDKLDNLGKRSIDSQIAAVNAKVASLDAENATQIQITREVSKRRVLEDQLLNIKKQNAIALKEEEEAISKVAIATKRELQALTGDSLGAEFLKIEEEMTLLKKRLGNNGRDTKIVDELFSVKKAAINMKGIDAEFQRLLTELNRASQNIDIDIGTGILTELQGRRELVKLQDKTLVQLKQLAPKAKEFSEAIGSPEANQNLQEIIDKITELTLRTNVLVNEVKGSFEDGFVDTLSSIGHEITTVDELWRSLVTNIVTSLQRIAAERLVAEAFSLLPSGADSARDTDPGITGGESAGAALSAVGSVAGAIGGGGGGEDSGVSEGDRLVANTVKSSGDSQKQGIIGQLLTVVAGIFTSSATETGVATTVGTSTSALLTSISLSNAGMFALMQAEEARRLAEQTTEAIGSIVGALHSGGMAGGGVKRNVNPMVFAGASRFHNGGVAGLKKDEVPAILQTREEVLSRDDPRNAANGGRGGQRAASSNINVMNVLDTSVLHDETASFLNSGDGERAIVNIMQRNKTSLG